MTKNSENEDQIIDSVKLPFYFDVKKMQQEIEVLKLSAFEYYNVIPLRSPAHLVNTSLPFPTPVDDYADGTWTDWLDTKELLNSPYM